jgi:hypothetical protein
MFFIKQNVPKYNKLLSSPCLFWLSTWSLFGITECPKSPHLRMLLDTLQGYLHMTHYEAYHCCIDSWPQVAESLERKTHECRGKYQGQKHRALTQVSHDFPSWKISRRVWWKRRRCLSHEWKI